MISEPVTFIRNVPGADHLLQAIQCSLTSGSEASELGRSPRTEWDEYGLKGSYDFFFPSPHFLGSQSHFLGEYVSRWFCCSPVIPMSHTLGLFSPSAPCGNLKFITIRFININLSLFSLLLLPTASPSLSRAHSQG